jgi:hypothetical protein
MKRANKAGVGVLFIRGSRRIMECQHVFSLTYTPTNVRLPFGHPSTSFAAYRNQFPIMSQDFEPAKVAKLLHDIHHAAEMGIAFAFHENQGADAERKVRRCEQRMYMAIQKLGILLYPTRYSILAMANTVDVSLLINAFIWYSCMIMGPAIDELPEETDAEMPAVDASLESEFRTMGEEAKILSESGVDSALPRYGEMIQFNYPKDGPLLDDLLAIFTIHGLIAQYLGRRLLTKPSFTEYWKWKKALRTEIKRAKLMEPEIGRYHIVLPILLCTFQLVFKNKGGQDGFKRLLRPRFRIGSVANGGGEGDGNHFFMKILDTIVCQIRIRPS